jgi:hypothetical protein
MKENIDRDRYGTCWQISADYTRFYAISGNPDTIFFGEICQNVFKEMQTLTRDYAVPEERAREIRGEWKSMLDAALRVMKSGNDNERYMAMRDMRVYMTRLQFDTWYTQRSREHRFALRSSGE